MGQITINRKDEVILEHAYNVHELNTCKDDYICSKQSANVLFKFMKKFDYLKEILKNKAIIPRYYEESIEYLNIEGLDKIVFPMICFCDINLSKLESHVHYYGKFGIALKKEWAIEKGVQPIHYISNNSIFRKNISYLFSKSLKNINYNNEYISEYSDYLLDHILFMKPVMGQMRREGGYDKRNFTDEKEWRYVPKIEEEDGIELVISIEYIKRDKAYGLYSNAITKINHLWLYFEINDIEYLMVENYEYRESLIEFILACDSIIKKDKYTLI